MELTLYCMQVSPWSHKARCALGHHRLTPREHEYTPLVDEPALRLRLRKLRGRVTVPVLFTPDGPITDSWEIALYADRVGAGAPLIPADKRAEVAFWNTSSERLLFAARGCTMLRVVRDPAAALSMLPPAVRAVAGRVGGATLSMRAFNAKYGIHERDLPQYEAAQREELDRLAERVADGRRFLLGERSYADFAMAASLTSLGLPAGRRTTAHEASGLWVDDALAKQYSQLVAWRDAIYAEQPW